MKPCPLCQFQNPDNAEKCEKCAGSFGKDRSRRGCRRRTVCMNLLYFLLLIVNLALLVHPFSPSLPPLWLALNATLPILLYIPMVFPGKLLFFFKAREGENNFEKSRGRVRVFLFASSVLSVAIMLLLIARNIFVIGIAGGP